MSRIAFSLVALLAVGGCSGRDAVAPMSAGTIPGASADRAGDDESSDESSHSGQLHITKECSAYTGLAGSFCTFTSSNLKQIGVGTRVVYAVAAGATVLDSDVILDPPGPGNSTAFGHCRLDFATGLGLCTFSGGTGKFKHFRARVDVSHLSGPNFAWDGRYSFSSE